LLTSLSCMSAFTVPGWPGGRDLVIAWWMHVGTACG